MKNLLFALLIGYTAVPGFAQKNITAASAKVLIIPYTDESGNLNTILDIDPNQRTLLNKIKSALDTRQFNTVDFASVLKEARDAKILEGKTSSEAKKALIKFSEAAIYIEAAYHVEGNDEAKLVNINLSAYDAATGQSAAFINCNSRERIGVDQNTLISTALRIPSPQSVKTSAIGLNNGLPCMDEFLNLLEDKMTKMSRAIAQNNGSRTTDETSPSFALNDIQPVSDQENFYALFIGNTKYNSAKWAPLKTVIEEEKSLIHVLSEQYGFKPEQIDTVFNQDRKTILTALSRMLGKMTSNDNLLLFYGGHGYFVERTNMAYWVPIGASDEFDYISNADINSLLSTSQARHILIMADACFSGAMRSGQEATNKYEYKFKSRQLLTSGGIEPVPGKSVYVDMIIRALAENQDPFLSARELYNRIFKGITDQTKTEPVLRDMQIIGSEGGQFYFKKN